MFNVVSNKQRHASGSIYSISSVDLEAWDCEFVVGDQVSSQKRHLLTHLLYVVLHYKF